MNKPWDFWVGFAVLGLVAFLSGAAVTWYAMTAAADYPQHRCFTCGR